MLRRGQSWCRRWPKRRLCIGAFDSTGLMVVVLEKLDVDGVGGARLESIAAEFAEWRKRALKERL